MSGHPSAFLDVGRYDLVMGETGEWDAVIDVSNVCWSPYLPPAGLRRPQWERLRLIMAGWRALHGDDVRFYLVADESLARAIDDDAVLDQRVDEFRRGREIRLV